jgi:hypothetical protein
MEMRRGKQRPQVAAEMRQLTDFNPEACSDKKLVEEQCECCCNINAAPIWTIRG